MRRVLVLPILSMFASDKLTNYSRSSVAPGVLSVFTTDRLAKVQSREGRQWFRNRTHAESKASFLPFSRACGRAAVEVPYQILS